jgi:hypothetical protein
MEHFYSSLRSREDWYLVRFKSGCSAVICADDLALLASTGVLELAIKVSFIEGKAFEATRSAFMSATCRLKSGESGGVG